ncbi:MAG: mechanosensitive ion channel [Planctomycetaceae bacterium]
MGMQILLAETTVEFFDEFNDWVATQYSAGDEVSYWLACGIMAAATIVLAAVFHFIVRTILVGVVRRISRRTKTEWDDILVKRHFFSRVSHLAPAAVIYFSALSFPDEWSIAVERFALCYMVAVGMMVIFSALNAVVDIYSTLDVSKTSPIKGFVGGAKLFVTIVGGILLLATGMGRDPSVLVAGIGAITAVLMLVFKDSILGLVASIQIITNDLVNVGDWIEIPKYGADGDVIDISLTTLKVQNFDKTITTIPTYAIISDSFKNWRGMLQSSGRRIKRAIAIDMTSVDFLTEEMISRFERYQLLSDYIKQRKEEVRQYNQAHNINTDEPINGRRLTNLGTFRAYLKEYLKHHPKIHQQMTLLVRQLAPTENGIPLELYVFSIDKVWANYEDIQGDIFDHILAVIPHFGLRVFQNPSGADFHSIQHLEAA